MNLKLCVSGKYLWKNKWKPYANLDALFMELFGVNVKKSGVKPFDIHPGIKREFFITKNGVKTKVNLEITISPNMSKENSQYFEGVLQVRNCTPDVEDYIRNEVSKMKEKGVYITKEVIKNSKADFFITNQTYIKSLANKLQKEFGGIINLNPQLFSRNRQSSRELFRLNLLLTLPKIRKNDILVADDVLWMVKSVKDKINVVNFEGKHSSLPYKEYAVLEKMETTVSKVRPEIEILEPETYQSVPLRNTAKVKVGEKIKVVFSAGWWIV